MKIENYENLTRFTFNDNGIQPHKADVMLRFQVRTPQIQLKKLQSALE